MPVKNCRQGKRVSMMHKTSSSLQKVSESYFLEELWSEIGTTSHTLCQLCFVVCGFLLKTKVSVNPDATTPPQPATFAQAQFIQETLLCFFSLYIMRSLRTNVTWNNCSESLTCFAIASSFAFSPTKHLGLLTDTFQKEYIATLPRSFRCVWPSMKKDRSQLIFGQQRLYVSSRRWWPDSVARVNSVFRVRGLFVPHLSDVLCGNDIRRPAWG